MTRLRLASVLTALLALTGGAAGPSVSPVSTQLVAAIVQIAREPARAIRVAAMRRHTQCRPPRPTSDVALAAGTQPLRSTDLPNSLFQRPPPRLS